MRARVVQLDVDVLLLLRLNRVDRHVHRHLDRADGDDLRPALGGEPRGDGHGLVHLEPLQDRDEDAPVVERVGRPEQHRRTNRRRQRRVHEAAPVHGVRDQPCREPAEAGVARLRVLEDDDDEGDARAREAEHREERPVDPADTEVRARAKRELGVGVAVADARSATRARR